MSSIGPSGYSYLAQVSPYVGALRSNSDTDAARSTAAQRAVEAEHQTLSAAELHETAEAERSADRDADGFYHSSGNPDDASPDASCSAVAEVEADGVIRGRHTRRTRSASDDYRGQLIDVQV